MLLETEKPLAFRCQLGILEPTFKKYREVYLKFSSSVSVSHTHVLSTSVENVAALLFVGVLFTHSLAHMCC